MKSKFLKILSVITVLVVVVTMFGCSAKKDDQKPTESSTTTDASTTVEKEPVTLSFLHYFGTENIGATGKGFYAGLDKFKAENTNVTVEEEILTHDAYETKIKILSAGNEMSDLFIVKGSMVENFVENGLIEPLDDALNADTTWRDSFLKGALATFNDKVYGVPFEMGTSHLVFYNKKMFSDVGVNSFPQTWTEFEDVIKKLKAAGITPIALGNKGKWVAESCILSTLSDRFTGPEWTKNVLDYKGGKFTDPEFVKALATLQNLAKMGAFNSDMNSIDNGQQQSMYQNGKAAMFMEGSWAIGSIVTNSPEEILSQTAVAYLPQVVGEKGKAMSTTGGSGAWAYNYSAKLTGTEKDMAIQLIKDLTSPLVAKVISENSSTPATKAEGVDKSKMAPLFAQFLDLFATTSEFTPIWDIELKPEVIEVMNSGLQELLIEVTTPEELAQKLQKEYENAK